MLEAAPASEPAVWDQINGEVDLLLTDMVMPDGMSGCELAEQLQSVAADLKVIYSSGYSEEIMGSDFQLSGLVPAQALQSPQLAQLVRQCLDPLPHLDLPNGHRLDPELTTGPRPQIGRLEFPAQHRLDPAQLPPFRSDAFSTSRAILFTPVRATFVAQFGGTAKGSETKDLGSWRLACLPRFPPNGPMHTQNYLPVTLLLLGLRLAWPQASPEPTAHQPPAATFNP